MMVSIAFLFLDLLFGRTRKKSLCTFQFCYIFVRVWTDRLEIVTICMDSACNGSLLSHNFQSLEHLMAMAFAFLPTVFWEKTI